MVAVGAISKLNKQIEDAPWHRPIQRKVAAKLRAGIKGYKQDVGAVCIWRCMSDLVLPDTKMSPTAKLMGDNTDRFWSITRSDGEFRVYRHHFAEAIEHLFTPALEASSQPDG